jgi:hypothetical protein
MTMTVPRTPVTEPRTPVTEPRTSDYGRLIISGQDRPGIVQAVSTVLAEAGANIVSLDQYSTAPGMAATSSGPCSSCRRLRQTSQPSTRNSTAKSATSSGSAGDSRSPPGASALPSSPRRPRRTVPRTGRANTHSRQTPPHRCFRASPGLRGSRQKYLNNAGP